MDWPRTLPFTDLQQWAVEAEQVGVWTRRRGEVFPLPEFPDDHLAEIRYLVEQDRKPPYWWRCDVAQIPSRSWSEWHWQRGIDPAAPRPGRPPIPRAVRELVMARDGLVCQICFGDVAPDDVHLDHIKPWSKGGEHRVRNLRVTHSLCNLHKAARWDGGV